MKMSVLSFGEYGKKLLKSILELVTVCWPEVTLGWFFFFIFFQTATNLWEKNSVYLIGSLNTLLLYAGLLIFCGVADLPKSPRNITNIDAKLIDFSEICQKQNWLFFTDCFSVSFALEITPEIGWFSHKFARENLSKLDFFPLKSCEISRFFSEFWLFPHENPAISADLSVNLPVKILWNLTFLY